MRRRFTRTTSWRLAAATVLAAGAAGLAVPAMSALPAAAAAGVGYVRLAHLSPDTPAVDVYLTSVSGAIPPKVFHAVGYGVVSGYMALPGGVYAVAMRAENSAPASPPVLSTQVSVRAGRAYTVAGVGRYADLGLRVINDDLSRPDSGQAKVRIVQASVRNPVMDVSVDGGARMGSAVAFATTTGYQEVKAGRWACRLEPPGRDGTVVNLRLAAGSVYSVIVLDKPNGMLDVALRTDARGGEMVPAGGVDTGAGGTASSRSGLPAVPVTAAVMLLLLVTGAAVGLRCRRRPARHW